MKSLHGVDPENPVGPEVVEVIRDEEGAILHMDGFVEVMEDEESRKPEVAPPERVGNPGVEVVVIRRWSVIGYDRGPWL